MSGRLKQLDDWKTRAEKAEAEPLLHDLLIHEILHSLGYHHDDPQAAEVMKEAQLLVKACM